jgi:hypothetical protein
MICELQTMAEDGVTGHSRYDADIQGSSHKEYQPGEPAMGPNEQNWTSYAVS